MLVSLGSRVGGSGAGEGWCIWRPGVEVVELVRAGDRGVPGVPCTNLNKLLHQRYLVSIHLFLSDFLKTCEPRRKHFLKQHVY